MKRNWKVITGLAALAVVGFWMTAFGALVLNGTNSLPHTAYYMMRQPLVLEKGIYVAFETPEILKDKFTQIQFVKRLVGRPGDKIRSSDTQVCIEDDCRTLHPKMIAAGYKPLQSGVIPQGQYLVFGDTPDSLDSRYAVIGTISEDKISASGLPIPLPHWKDIAAWLHG